MLRPSQPFFLIRHGETDWNVERRFQGQRDIPINENGRKQARGNGLALAAMNEDWSGHAFIASTLGRCRTTMEIIRDAMGLDASDYETDPRLMELTFGEWEGQRLADLAQTEPDAVAERSRDKWSYLPPGGESYVQAADRVRPVLTSLQRPSVIVTHGGIIRATRHLIEGIKGEEASKGTIPQDRIYRYDGKAGGWL